ncbi:MAG: GTP-binding protein [Candidatus Kariarchaeaceae archaeon]|jgi:small GTP-binding protein
MSKPILIRLALMGDGAVGKTSLRKQYMGKGFQATHMMTIGSDFAVHNTIIEVDGTQREVMFQIWDLAGQPNFKAVRARFFKGAVAGLCIFDINRRETYNNIPSWIDELWQNNGRGIVPVVLLGNKADLRNKKSVSQKESIKYAKLITERVKNRGFRVEFLETSAKTGLNVKEAFRTIAQQVVRAFDQGTIKVS